MEITLVYTSDYHMTVTWQSHLLCYHLGWRWSVLCSEVWDCQEKVFCHQYYCQCGGAGV